MSDNSSKSVSVDSAELILQFFKENDLNISFEALQKETKVSLNVVPDPQVFMNDIKQGHWDRVLSNISSLKIPINKLMNLYEHIVLELLELEELELAKTVLKQTQPLIYMKKSHPQRYLHLEALLNRNYLESNVLYPINDRQKRRCTLASELMREIIMVDSSRLLTLLGQALKYQNTVGLLGLENNECLGEQYDLFRGCVPTQEAEEECYPRTSYKTIKFSYVAIPEVIKFSPDGSMMIVGLTNGFIEVYDPKTVQLRRDLPYQARDEFMSHKGMILAMSFSKRGDFLISAGQYGIVKIWKLVTGDCIKAFEGVHTEPITSVCLDNNEKMVLTTSFDNTLKLHGLRNGQTIRIFKGHTNVVNCACWTKDNTSIISASSDGYVMIWNAETAECTLKFKPVEANSNVEIPIHSLVHIFSKDENFVFGTKSDQIVITDKEGREVKIFTIPKPSDGNASHDILSIVNSPRSGWIYAAVDNGIIHCFNLITGELENSLSAHDSEIIGMHQHPYLNIFVSYTTAGEVKLWKS